MEKTTRTFHSPVEPAVVPKLLVVEDDAALARGLERTLGQSGFEVTLAADGVIASDVLTTRAFDLVLSDINLPGANGIELLQLVRAYDLDVPVILMTGNPNLETAMQAVELGALRYLPKPLDMDLLTSA